MIISKEEFGEMGFVCSALYDQTLENCIKRAEYILNAMCGGTLASAMAQSESNAALIKQAAAFETDALLKTEISDGELTRVSVGDFSYSAEPKTSPQNVPQTVKNLLRAAGCFSLAAVEVIE